MRSSKYSFTAFFLRAEQRLISTLALPCLFFVSACNSVFYQPDNFEYSLPEQVTPSFEELRIPVGDQGEHINVWKFHSRAARLGTIVHFHGNAQNMSAHVWFVAWLIDAGYDVVTFDYRGYGGSDGVATRTNTVEDGQAVLQWLFHQPQNSPIFILGQSLGGAVAFASLAGFNEPPPVRGVIIESSFHSYRQLARKKLASFFLTWPLQWPLSFLVTDTLSPRSLFLKHHFPMLFIHGNRDIVVPYSEGFEFAEKAEAGKNIVSFYTDEGRGHTSCFAHFAATPCKLRVLQFLSSLSDSADSRGSIEKGLPK